jgi:F0F1-type ATP synthase assembly protein I
MALPTSRWELVSLGFELGFVIAVPLLVGLKLGQMLDIKWSTSPWLTLTGLALALIFTGVWLIRKLRPYL